MPKKSGAVPPKTPGARFSRYPRLTYALCHQLWLRIFPAIHQLFFFSSSTSGLCPKPVESSRCPLFSRSARVPAIEPTTGGVPSQTSLNQVKTNLPVPQANINLLRWLGWMIIFFTDTQDTLAGSGSRRMTGASPGAFLQGRIFRRSALVRLQMSNLKGDSCAGHRCGGTPVIPSPLKWNLYTDPQGFTMIIRSFDIGFVWQTSR